MSKIIRWTDVWGRPTVFPTATPGARSTVVLMGDSLTAQNSPGPGTVGALPTIDTACSRGSWVWANAFLGDRFAPYINKGVGGQVTSQMLARFDVDVLQQDTDWVVINGGANDVGQDIASATTIANLSAMIDRALKNNRRVLVYTVAPSTSYSTPARLSALHAVNRWIRTLPMIRRGVHVADAWAAVVDPATGFPATQMSVDGIHWSEQAAMRIGRIVANALDRHVPLNPVPAVTETDPKSVCGNPMMTGGTGWTTINSQGTSFTFAPLPDRAGSEATITLSGVTDTLERGVQYVENISNGRYVVGDIVAGTARIKFSDLVLVPAGKVSRPYMRILARLADGTQYSNVFAMGNASSSQLGEIGYLTAGEVVVRTPRLILPANIDRLYTSIGWQGAQSGIIKVSDVSAWKE